MEDFFTLYFRYCEDTECPLIYHRWCAIGGIAALLERQFYVEHGHSNIYPNFYTMLIGSPGTRKGTGIKIINKLLRLQGYDKFASSRTSKEKFLADLCAGGFASAVPSGGTNADDAWEELEVMGAGRISSVEERCCVFISSDEFTDFIGAGNIEFISLLTNLWDCLPYYSHRIKTAKSVYVNEPTINILSGNTPTGFATAFPPEIIGQGMLSRLLLIYGETTGRKIPFPLAPSEGETRKLVDALERIKQTVFGIGTFEESATRVLGEIYTSWRELDDSRLKSYSTRRFTHLLKLCLICAAAHYTTRISKDIVVLANSILSFAESRMSNALGEFGKSKNADVSGKLLQYLAERTKPATLGEMWKFIHSDLNEIGELAKIIQSLQQAEKIQKKDKGFLVQRDVSTKEQKYVEYNILKESTEL